MLTRTFVTGLLTAAALFSQGVGYKDTPVIPGQTWRVHDSDRPNPPLVTPGDKPGDPPSDAVILFDGKDLSKWYNLGRRENRGKVLDAQWKVGNGYFECVGNAGDLLTREKFGDIQLHIEYSSPADPKGTSQERGNSGVLLMGRYEIQVLDSWENKTYADGQAGSIYGQWPPLVNPVRKPGEWNIYDIFFEAPKFQDGKLVKPAYVTVIMNGVMLHHHKEIIGRMAHRIVGTYAPHEAEESFGLQDHGTPVRYRNVWIRRLKAYDQKQ